MTITESFIAGFISGFMFCIAIGIIVMEWKIVRRNRMNIVSDIAGDNRFEIIKKAKKDLIESTNIEMSPNEMNVLDDFLFRCWQMGWLRKYEDKQNENK